MVIATVTMREGTMESKNKFTPGPWYIVAYETEDSSAITTTPDVDPCSREHEVLGSSEWLFVEPADLRLMAAAPDLYEALEDLLLNYKENKGKGLGIGPIMKAKTALAKARGEE
jgi:hypothetical protein